MTTPVLQGHFNRMTSQLVDSEIETTRVYWRKTYFGATDEEASDPRPFEEVMKARK